jgi:sulfur carrier protein
MNTSPTASDSVEATVEVIVNGDAREVPGGATLAALLRAVGRDPEQPGVAVAVEGEVVRRADWHDTTLTGGENVEVVAAQQGG